MKFNQIKMPLSFIAGITVIIFYCTFTFISILLFPGPYNPIDNYLSDLGNSTYNPNGAIIYNLGCMLTGTALFLFFIGLSKFSLDELPKKILLHIIQIIGCFAAFADFMIGIFSEDYITAHIFWSVLYFFLMFLTLIISGIFFLYHPDFDNKIAIYGFIVVVVYLLFLLTFSPLFEWIAVFTSLAYIGLIAYNMYNITNKK